MAVGVALIFFGIFILSYAFRPDGKKATALLWGSILVAAGLFSIGSTGDRFGGPPVEYRGP